MPFLNDLDPVAVSIGPLAVHWYGLMYLLGFVSVVGLGTRRVKAGLFPGVESQAFADLILVHGVLGVVLGGRIGYMLFYALSDWMHDPLLVFRVWDGGMSFHGGLLGVIVAVFWWSRVHRRHLFDTLDFIAPLVPIGLGFGRIGNFIGGELWGKFTGSQWGVLFPRAPELADLGIGEVRAQYAAGALDQYARHPTQLYEAGLEGLLLFLVLYTFSRRRHRRYAVSGLFALLYGVFRFAIEFVREPDVQLGYLAFGWVTMGQILSLPLIALGIFLLVLARRQPHPDAAQGA